MLPPSRSRPKSVYEQLVIYPRSEIGYTGRNVFPSRANDSHHELLPKQDLEYAFNTNSTELLICHGMADLAAEAQQALKGLPDWTRLVIEVKIRILAQQFG